MRFHKFGTDGGPIYIRLDAIISVRQRMGVCEVLVGLDSGGGCIHVINGTAEDVMRQLDGALASDRPPELVAAINRMKARREEAERRDPEVVDPIVKLQVDATTHARLDELDALEAYIERFCDHWIRKRVQQHIGWRRELIREGEV